MVQDTNSVSSLRQMGQKREEWLNSKPKGDWGSEFSVKSGDMAIVNFVSSGNDGDTFIKMYRAHELERLVTPKNSQPFMTSDNIYCAGLSGDGESDCPWCKMETPPKTKERMSIWFYVHAVLHTTQPQGQNYPVENYQGRNYFKEEVNDFKIWHTSAWSESPWNDILNIAELYNGLHPFTAQLLCVGTGLQTRYKVYAIPNSQGFPSEGYEKAKEVCTPIPQILREQASSYQVAPVQQAMQTTQQAPAPWFPTSSSASNLPGAAPSSGLPGAASTAPQVEQNGEIPFQVEENPVQPLRKLF